LNCSGARAGGVRGGGLACLFFFPFYFWLYIWGFFLAFFLSNFVVSKIWQFFWNAHYLFFQNFPIFLSPQCENCFGQKKKKLGYIDPKKRYQKSKGLKSSGY
jgi:hypothetical protein